MAKPEFSPSVTMGLDSHIPHTLRTTSLVQQDQLFSISPWPDRLLFCDCLLHNGFLQVWRCKENLSK